MKKFLGSLIVASLAVSSVAVAENIRLTNGTYNNAFPVLEPVDYVNGERIFGVDSKTTIKLNYTVTDSVNRVFGHYTHTNFNIAHVSFSSNQDVALTVWHDIDGKATPGEAHVDLGLTIKEYGIYFLDEDYNGMHNYRPLSAMGTSVAAGREFGVYYKGSDEYNEGAYYTTTDNYVGSFDGSRDHNHVIGTDTTNRSFFCLFQGTHGNFPAELEWDHFEFGFATAASNLGGQPLPGLLMTLGLGGAAVAGISRKRKNRKA